MKSENLAFGMLIWVFEEDFAIDTSGTDESWVEGIDFVGCHDDFYVAAVVETVELVEEFEHGSLDFALASGLRFVTFGSDGVDFVNEDNGGCIFGGDLI